MSLLPHADDAEPYLAEVHRQPPETWQAALNAIAGRHGLPAAPWERAALGRNVVFLGPSTVIKLGPPCWPGDIAREADALGHVGDKLPVRTPAVLAHGTLEGWEYLVATRCPGANLYHHWRELDAAARIDLARQHGALMATVHSLPVAALPPSLLRFDWERMLAEQRAELEPALARSGVAAELVARAANYVAEAAQFADLETTALVHGALSHLNFMVEQRDGRWTVTGLLDWGDVKVGPWTHELISPAVHMYLGERDALRAWLGAYGRVPSQAVPAVAHVATARAMLYYAEEFGAILGRLPGGPGCRDWFAVARCLWQLDAQ